MISGTNSFCLGLSPRQDFLFSGEMCTCSRNFFCFTPLVKVVELGVLPRSEKKTQRVFDERYE